MRAYVRVCVCVWLMCKAMKGLKVETELSGGYRHVVPVISGVNASPALFSVYDILSLSKANTLQLKLP